MSQAFVTLSTNDAYCLGALTLASSLKAVGTSRKLVILITPDVSASMRDVLEKSFDVVKVVDLINSKEDAILNIMKRPELGVTLTKIHCWRLIEFEKCIFMDADTLVVKNIDELFKREELSAVSDIGWPDCFNTGLFVYSPSEKTYNELTQLLAKEGTFDGGDQGLLNSYFSDWSTADIKKHLSFIYNMSSIAVYSYPPAYKKFGDKVKVVHFIGILKPWMYGYNRTTKRVIQPSFSQSPPQQLEHVQIWWNIFMESVQPILSIECRSNAPLEIMDDNKAHLVPDLHSPHFGSGEYNEMMNWCEMDQYVRKKNWETGNIDYLGSDRFENIQKKLDEVIGQ